MGLRSDWESLAPEILALVLQRVLEAGCGQRGEGRRIVAVAGVCRSWRQVVLQQQQEAPASAPVMQQKSVTCYRSSTSSSSSSSSSLIRFPASIRRQAATDWPLQCVLKKKGNSFFFFQSLQSLLDHDAGAVGGQEEYFLLAARKRYMPSCSSFEISTDTKSLVQKGTTRAAAASGCSSVQASVKSNFSRSEFVVLLHNNNEAADPAREKSPLRVKYSEEIVGGARQRKLSCGLKSPATSSSSSGTASTTKSRSSKSRISRTTAMTSQGAPSLPCNAPVTSSATRTVRSFLTAPWSCFLNTRSRQVSRSRVHSATDLEAHDEKQLLVSEHHAAAEEADQDWEAAPAAAGRLSLKSKAPEWNQERRCWSLDFKGRATMASIHNFQLLVSSSDSATSSNSAAANPDHQRVVLQMGKVGKGIYLVDVFSPLSALDAFSICLTSFATNVGLEP
jgi:hypothetical protein